MGGGGPAPPPPVARAAGLALAVPGLALSQTDFSVFANREPGPQVENEEHDHDARAKKTINAGWLELATGTSTATATEYLTGGSPVDVSTCSFLKVEAVYATVTGSSPTAELGLVPYSQFDESMGGVGSTVYPRVNLTGPVANSVILLAQGSQQIAGGAVSATNGSSFTALPVPSKVRLLKTHGGTWSASSLRWTIWCRK